MRRLIATILLASFALLTVTFAGLSVFGMHDETDMSMDTCVGAHCETMPMPDTSANDVGCINDCLASVSALTSAVLPVSLAFGFLALLFVTALSELLTLAEPMKRAALRWREGIGLAFRRQSLATVILRN